jgi:hypothetical protein
MELVGGQLQILVPVPATTATADLELAVAADSVQVAIAGAEWWRSTDLPIRVDADACKAKVLRKQGMLRITLAPLESAPQKAPVRAAPPAASATRCPQVARARG